MKGKGECQHFKVYADSKPPCRTPNVVFKSKLTPTTNNETLINLISSNLVQEVNLKYLVRANLKMQQQIGNRYTHEVDIGTLGNQHHSGRCWIFAGLAILSQLIPAKITYRRFSPNFIYYYDQLEKCDKFIAEILNACQEDFDGKKRTVEESIRLNEVINTPIYDGGNWAVLMSLITKYGLVPMHNFPDTESSNKTAEMRNVLRDLLLRAFQALKKAHSAEELSSIKDDTMHRVKSILNLFLNSPANTLILKDTQLKKVKDPLSYARTCFQTDNLCMLKEKYITLCCYKCVQPDVIVYTRTLTHPNEPTQEELNVSIETLKQAIMSSLATGVPVFAAVNISNRVDSESGFANMDLPTPMEIVSELTMPIGSEVDRALSEMAGHNLPNHAVAITGVEVNSGGKPLKWRLHNSYGNSFGSKGVLHVADSWFNQYVFSATLRRDYINEKEKYTHKSASTPKVDLALVRPFDYRD
mgnify:CR=1 FL=1